MRATYRLRRIGGFMLAAAWTAWTGAAAAHPVYRDVERKLMAMPVPADLDVARVRSGQRFRIAYAPVPAGDVPLNRLHAWDVVVTDLDGRAVEDAQLWLRGGMPQHVHGLGSAPAIAPLGHGRFRVDGLRFHMPGWWRIEMIVKAGEQEESVFFDLMLGAH
jgi:hypothetical protein